MDRDAIIARVNALNLPHPQGVIIVAGAAMAMIGLRTTNDIDLVVDSTNWNYLTNLDGWSIQSLEPHQTRMTDSMGIFDVWPGWVDKRTQPYSVINFEEIEANAPIDVSGHRIPTVSQQITMKRQLARPKDRDDIEALKRLL